MKTIKIITSAAILLLISAITFYSCKKNATNETDKPIELAEFYKQKLKKEPQSVTQTVNLEGKGYYGDIAGNRISIVPGNSDKTSCPDPGSSEFTQLLVSVTREFTCNVGYRFVVSYKITSEFYPLLTGSGQSSRGRIKLVNSSGAQVYITPSGTINPVISIVNNGVVGQNSNGADLNEFLITYRSEIISEAVYNLSSAVQANLTCYTDCVNYPTLNIGFSSQQQVLGSQQNSQPCLRIDKVYWNPRSGSTPPSLSGCNPTGSACFPAGYVYPAKQEIAFKKNSTDDYSGVFGLKPYLTATPLPKPLINYYDVYYIDIATSTGLVPGNVQVRYRNNQNTTANGGPCTTKPDGTWIYETWTIN